MLKIWIVALAVLIQSTPIFGQIMDFPKESEGIISVSPDLCKEMRDHHVMNKGAPVGCDRLKVVNFFYIDFEGEARVDGKIIVLDALATSVLQIFQILRQRKFPVARAKLI